MKKALIIANMLFASATVFGMRCDEICHKAVDGILPKEYLVTMMKDSNYSYVDRAEQERRLKEAKKQAKEFYESMLEGDDDLKNFASKMIDDKVKGFHQLDPLEASLQTMVGSSFHLEDRVKDHEKGELIEKVISGNSDKSDREKLEKIYKSDPYGILKDFSITVSIEEAEDNPIIHEVGHALHYFNGIRYLNENKEYKNSNKESVSVYFEVLAGDPKQKKIRLKNMLDKVIHYEIGRHRKVLDPWMKATYEEGGINNYQCLLDFLCKDKYHASLYNAFKLLDRISAGEISVLEGMNEAMYGKIPDLTREQLHELIDRLAS
jgi:hypothetical protein